MGVRRYLPWSLSYPPGANDIDYTCESNKLLVMALKDREVDPQVFHRHLLAIIVDEGVTRNQRALIQKALDRTLKEADDIPLAEPA